MKEVTCAPSSGNEKEEALRHMEKPRDFDPFGQTGFGPLWLQYD